MQRKNCTQYLGALISADGTIQSELNRRIGMAASDFIVLDVLWKHTKVSRKHKYQIFIACIVSKLLYGLQTSWLTKVRRTKLDGFQAKCVRKICGVQHSYWSRITNAEVLSYVDATKLSDLLLEQQLLVFGKIFRKPLMMCCVKQFSRRSLIRLSSVPKPEREEDQSWHGPQKCAK